MKKILFINVITILLLFLWSCGSDNATLDNRNGDVSLSYEVESSNYTTPINKNEENQRLPVEVAASFPRIDRAKVSVCYQKKGTYSMTIENIASKGNAKYPVNGVGSIEPFQYSKIVFEDNNIKVYATDGSLLSSAEDTDNLVEDNKKLVESILTYKPMEEGEIDKLIPALKLNGLDARESNDKKFISWQQAENNGGSKIYVINKETGFLAGWQEYNAQKVKTEQTMINVQREGEKITVKNFTSIEDFISPLSKIKMRRIFQSSYANFNLNVR